MRSQNKHDTYPNNHQPTTTAPIFTEGVRNDNTRKHHSEMAAQGFYDRRKPENDVAPDIWAENPWDLPYDAEYVHRVQTQPPTHEQFWGKTDIEASRAVKIARGIGGLALRGVQFGAAAGLVVSAAAPATIKKFGEFKEATWRGVDFIAASTGLEQDGSIRQFATGNIDHGSDIKYSSRDSYNKKIQKARELAKSPANRRPSTDKDLADVYLKSARRAHLSGDPDEASRKMANANMYRRLEENRKASHRRLGRWWHN